MEPAADQSLFWIARQRSVVMRAAKIAAVVGVILALINHGDSILGLRLTWGDGAKILLTFCVPYCVSTFSSVLAIRERSQFLARQEGQR